MKRLDFKKIKNLNFKNINRILSYVLIGLLMLSAIFLIYKKNPDSFLGISVILNLNNKNFVLENNTNVSNFSNNNSNNYFSSSPTNTINNSNISANSSSNKTTKTIVSGGGGGSSGGGGGSSSSPADSIPPDTSSNNQTNTINNTQAENSSYFLHEDITTTLFWVGERASKDNDYISNTKSAWDEAWKEHYGGIDSPYDRDGYLPAGFVPKENPFYIALPYNDFDDDGERKQNSQQIPWADEKSWGELESICKNQWIKIIKGDNAAYAQWEDAGPFEEDDFDYVFGEDSPRNEINDNSGLDVSPAVRDYLNLEDVDEVSWQFVDFSEVPDGPWKIIITSSQIFWE